MACSEEEPDMPDSWWIREDPADLFHLSEGPFRPASAPWGAHTDGRATANADASLETVRLSGGARNAGGHQEGRSGRVEEGIEGARGETGRGGTRAEERPDLSVLPRERAMWQPGVEATIWAGHRSAGYEEYVVSPDVASSSVRKQLVRTVRSLRRSKAGTLLMDEMDRSAAAKSPLGACMSAHLYYGSISTPAEVLPAPGMPPSRPRVDICQNVPRCTCGGAVLRAEQRRLRRKGKGRPARPEERSRCKSPVCARVVELEEPRKGECGMNVAPVCL